MASTFPDAPPSRKRKLSEIISEQLMEEIKVRGWPVGQSVGTESELMKRFNASRATIIEAARQVEGHGVAAMRRGSGGGLYVLNSATTAVSRAIATFLELSSVSLAEQYEMARMVETAAARLTAEHATEEKAAELRVLAKAVSEARDGVEMHSLAMKLRIAIADASGCRPLGLFMRSLARLLTNYVRPDLRAHYRDLSFEHGVAADMWAQVEAIVAGDSALADSIARFDVERRELRARTLAVAQPLLASGPLRRDTGNKLAELVALAIRNDIVRNGWRPGDRLANESELPDRYGSSQWVIRQSIRLLELHGIVAMRRGQGGGLFVGEANPDYTVQLAANFFDVDTDLRTSGVLELRRHLLKNVARFAAIRGSTEEAAGLIALCRGTDFTAERFVAQLSMMARNRILALFSRILSTFVVVDGRVTEVWGTQSDALRVAEAIAVGDAPLSRRRMHAFCGEP